MTEQIDFYRKLGGSEIVGIGTKNMERLHTITARTTSGEADLYLWGYDLHDPGGVD